MQIRPKVLMRLLFHPGADYRHAMRWYTQVGRRVWFHEVAEFIFNTRVMKQGPTLRDFMGSSLAHREYALTKNKRVLKNNSGEQKLGNGKAAG